uniref:Endo/exonuclease/phosphatase domain-containing protein n=1 Tax=Haemonchus placei TaxID=6290 RepID=A0A0N4WDK5_HAEPC
MSRVKGRLVRKLNNPNRTFATKKMWLIFVAYSPTSSYEEEELEAFFIDLERIYKEDHTFFKVIVGDIFAKIGPRRTAEELYIGTHGSERNEQGERLSEFIMSQTQTVPTHIIHGNSQFQKPSHLRWTWESPGGQFHNEIDHIIFNRRFLTDAAVVPKFYMGSDHCLLRSRFCFSMRTESYEFKETKSQDFHQLGLLRFSCK